jgi:hypothetical protein
VRFDAKLIDRYFFHDLVTPPKEPRIMWPQINTDINLIPQVLQFLTRRKFVIGK